MRAALAGVLMLGACASHGSWVDPSVSDDGGVLASAITDVALRGGRDAVFVVPLDGEHAIGPTVPASIEGVGIAVREDGEPLRYLISRLYGGVLLRVLYAGRWTASLFGISGGELVGRGPMTIQEAREDVSS